MAAYNAMSEEKVGFDSLRMHVCWLQPHFLKIDKENPMATPLRRIFGLALAGTTLAALVACGSCDDDLFLTVKGVAAQGLAIEGGATSVQCAFGSGSTTTAANGSYSVSITNGVGPCLVTVTKNALIYRSIAPATSTDTTVANVTPFTDVIVAGLITAKGANSAENLVNTTAYIPTNSDIIAANAEAVVKINLALVAINLTPLANGTDLMNSPTFTPATTSNLDAGDTVDKALDALVQEGALNGTLISSITAAVDAVVAPNAGSTGGTGGTGGTGSSGGVN